MDKIKNYTSEVPVERSITKIEKMLVEAKAMDILKEYKGGELASLNINKGSTYSIPSLRNALKLKRFLFRNREEQAAIVSALEQFSAKTALEFTSTNDYAGNVVYSKISKCTSNLPLNFTLKTNIFVGYDPVEFEVNIEVTPDNGSLILNLLSQDLVDELRKVTGEAFTKVEKELAYIPLVNC